MENKGFSETYRTKKHEKTFEISECRKISFFHMSLFQYTKVLQEHKNFLSNRIWTFDVVFS